MTTYLVPASAGEAELTEKRSRFIGHVQPVESEEEARAYIEQMKKTYHDARHNCWCYRLREGGVERYSDDGEPQGTAGQPMLGVFQKEGVVNAVCVVTRYFGGVLLGAGGLVRAYSAAAKMALDEAGVSRMARWLGVSLHCSYAQYERVKRLLEEQEAVIEDTAFGADVAFSALLREDTAGDFRRRLTELTAGSVEAVTVGESFRGVRIR
ncbi:MAG: YigZ family protein [Oscillospiraceae bacterium]